MRFEKLTTCFVVTGKLNMTSNTSKNVFLDVDPSIVEKNLRFAADPTEEEFNKIFQQTKEQYPSKLVKPFPGFCIKTREVGSATKFFVNICHTDAIPPPKDITEKELANILDSDEISDYRVPMSIGDVHPEVDKKGEKARVSDVAINPIFFRKIEQSQLFKSFFTTIVFEGLKEKHGIICHDEKIILKNRKAFGTLQMHRIQQREIDEKMKNVKNTSLIEEICGNTDSNKSRPLIEIISDNEIKCGGPEEICGNTDSNQSRPLIEMISENKIKCRVPKYRLFRKKSQPNCLIGEFEFPDIISSKELTLDIGEDRIVIESTSKHYLLDIFVPFVIRQTSCTSAFNKSSKVLTVTMPLVGG